MPDPAEGVAANAGNPVVPGEAFVEHQEVRVNEGVETQILMQDLAEKCRGLANHRLVERQIIVRMQGGIDLQPFKLVEAQPLPGEVGHEGLGPGILQHAPDLGREDVGLQQVTRPCPRKQLLIRHAAPEEIRET